MINKIRRKEIYIADLGNTIGSEQKGRRPVLIVQNDTGNRYSPTTIILPMTKRIENIQKLPTHIIVKPFGNIKYDGIIFAEQLKVIDKRRLKKYIDILPDQYMKEVDHAIEIAVGLYKERSTNGIYR